MKKLLLALATMLFVTGGVQAQAVNINNLNVILKGIVDPIVAQDSFFEDLSLVFDPSTDLANNYVSVELSASSKSLAWTQSLSALSVEIVFDLQNYTPTESVAKGNLTLSLDTDVYGFSQYVVAMSQALSACAMPYDMNTDVYGMDFLLCEYVNQTLVAGDFAELKSNLENLIPTIQTQLQDLRLVLQAEISTQTDPDTLDTLQRSLENVEEYLESANEISVVSTPEEVIFTVDEQALNGPGSDDEWTINLMVSEQKIFVSLGIEHYHATGSYDSFVDMLNDTLFQIEQNDPDTIDYVRTAAQGYLEFAKMFLTF